MLIVKKEKMMNEEEIIRIIDKEIEKVNYNQQENKADAFGLNPFDSYYIAIRDIYNRLQGAKEALMRIKGLIVEEFDKKEKENK